MNEYIDLKDNQIVIMIATSTYRDTGLEVTTYQDVNTKQIWTEPSKRFHVIYTELDYKEFE